MVELTEMRILSVALILMLVPFGLIVWGVLEGIAVLWWAGIVLLVIGGSIPALSRYAFDDGEEE